MRYDSFEVMHDILNCTQKTVLRGRVNEVMKIVENSRRDTLQLYGELYEIWIKNCKKTKGFKKIKIWRHS